MFEKPANVYKTGYKNSQMPAMHVSTKEEKPSGHKGTFLCGCLSDIIVKPSSYLFRGLVNASVDPSLSVKYNISL